MVVVEAWREGKETRKEATKGRSYKAYTRQRYVWWQAGERGRKARREEGRLVGVTRHVCR